MSRPGCSCLRVVELLTRSTILEHAGSVSAQRAQVQARAPSLTRPMLPWTLNTPSCAGEFLRRVRAHALVPAHAFSCNHPPLSIIGGHARRHPKHSFPSTHPPSHHVTRVHSEDSSDVHQCHTTQSLHPPIRPCSPLSQNPLQRSCMQQRLDRYD